MKRKQYSWILSILLLSSSCKVGPDYQLPFIKTPEQFKGKSQIDTSLLSTSTQRKWSYEKSYQAWWEVYEDPILSNLIRQGRKNNASLEAIRARVEQAWVQRKVLYAAFFPHVDANTELNYGLGSFDRSGVTFSPSTKNRDELAQINVGWELDFWGRISRQKEGSDADYEASVEGYRDALIFISGEIALHYTAIRAIEARIQVVEESVQSFKEIQQIVQTRTEEGIAAELDMSQALARLANQETILPNLRKELSILQNQLATLSGKYAGELNPLLEKNKAEIPFPPKQIKTSLPANLLRARPDIRRAERQIAAETARVGVAVANLYPQLSLSGAISYEASFSNGVRDLFTRTLGLGPKLRWRLFHACADQARIQEQKQAVEITLKRYEAVILSAYQEVEDVLASIQYEQQTLQSLKKATEANQKNASLSREAYDVGTIDLVRLLNAHRDYYFTKSEMIACEGRLVAHTIRLFKALGGGESPFNYFDNKNNP